MSALAHNFPNEESRGRAMGVGLGGLACGLLCKFVRWHKIINFSTEPWFNGYSLSPANVLCMIDIWSQSFVVWTVRYAFRFDFIGGIKMSNRQKVTINITPCWSVERALRARTYGGSLYRLLFKTLDAAARCDRRARSRGRRVGPIAHRYRPGYQARCCGRYHPELRNTISGHLSANALSDLSTEHTQRLSWIFIGLFTEQLRVYIVPTR